MDNHLPVRSGHTGDIPLDFGPYGTRRDQGLDDILPQHTQLTFEGSHQVGIREHQQAAVQTLQQAAHPKRGHAPGGGEFDRQRQANQAPAQLGHHRRIGVGQFEVVLRLAGGLYEQLDRWKAQGFGRCRRFGCRRAFHRL